MILLYYLVLHFVNQTGLQEDCRNSINKQEKHIYFENASDRSYKKGNEEENRLYEAERLRKGRTRFSVRDCSWHNSNSLTYLNSMSKFVHHVEQGFVV